MKEVIKEEKIKDLRDKITIIIIEIIMEEEILSVDILIVLIHQLTN
jgi:hypothetical protein